MKTKKLFVLLTASILALSLAACGSTGDGTPTASADPAPESTDAASSTDPVKSTVPAESTTPTEAEDGKALVAYFSWSGNTEKIANLIAANTGAELFKIETAEPYTDDYNTLLEVAQNEQRESARPALSATVEDMAQYDTIYLGWPCWWSDCPMAILTFLESYDFSGKTIVPFTTSGGSGFGRSLTSVENAAPNATLLDGLSVGDDDVDSAESIVGDWLTGLELAQ